MTPKQKQVIKGDGSLQEFDPHKIGSSIWLAAKKVGGTDENLANELGQKVLELIYQRYPNGKILPTYEIGEMVERVLIEEGQVTFAQEYIRYRENKKHARQDKASLGVVDDIGLSYNTLYILKRRYLQRNDEGAIVETPRGMIERVARSLAAVEKGKNNQEKWFKAFYEIMSEFLFLPGTRTLANSGKKASQLANCFVWPLEDDTDQLFDILHKSTLIKRNGGGCGYNFSNIRPEGDLVNGIPELAVGPVKMIGMFDLMTSMFRQEGRYESGNMAILNANHPDIFSFITAKQQDGMLPKTNISVGITDEFMDAAIKNKDWELINPRTGQVVNKVKAKSILDLMASMAWQTGDPGIINLSAMNKGTALGNPLLKKRGVIQATNPCGEVPLYPFESCNLGYVNFVKFVKDGEFDFAFLEKVMKVAVRLMDNVIEASWFPVDEVTKAVKNHRRIGIGCVGWAEVLTILEIAYDDPKAFMLAEKITEVMYKSAFEASCDLAEEKGPFPLVSDSIWANRKKQPRNVALLTFPPSSGNAVICETSFGVEPYFALAYEQNVLGGMRLRTVVPILVEKLKQRGIYSETLIQKIIDNHGSIQGIDEVPDDLQKIFKVAHDIDWKDHIKMQASFQKWTDNAITKTINMSSDATPTDIRDAYVLAWKLGCKGLTVYRDRSKKDQVFEFGANNTGVKLKNAVCPSCEGKLIKEGKCMKCKKCGYSSCEV